jgi:ABC-type enterochelin transport system substrate-binding protein
MKLVITTALFAALLAACSSNQQKGSDDLVDAGSSPKTKKVCETVRTNQTGQRLRRVCKTVVVKDDSDDSEES